jgi:hypothetical protein
MFWPVSTLGCNLNPRNTESIPAVQILCRFDIDHTKTL